MEEGVEEVVEDVVVEDRVVAEEGMLLEEVLYLVAAGAHSASPGN